MKATATKNVGDQKYIHKKEDNYVVLRLMLDLGDKYKMETSELCFGFYMTTNSDRF